MVATSSQLSHDQVKIAPLLRPKKALLVCSIVENPMINQTLDAVFQNGAFHQLSPSPAWNEGQQVRLIVEVEEPDVLALAAEVLDGLSDEEKEEVERIALERRDLLQGRAE